MTSILAGAVQSALSPNRVANQQERAATTAAKAALNPEAFGKQMATDFLKAVAGITGTWQTGVVYLLKSCKDKDQEAAMTAALKVAEAEADENAASSLRKRISEARRVFKASRENYGDTVKHMMAKGGWHAKITTLPKASNKGRKKNNGAGKSSKPIFDPKVVQAEAQKIIGKHAAPAQLAKVVALVTKATDAARKAGTEEAEKNGAVVADRHAKPDLGMVVGTIKAMSPGDLRKVLDVTLFHLTQAKLPYISKAAEETIVLFAKADDAGNVKLERTGTEG